MPDQYRLILPVVLAVAVLGCTQDSQSPAEAQSVPVADTAVANEETGDLQTADGIDWFAGSVEDAFEHAKAGGKPIFLYWGAEWCPPCHMVKATVFRSAEFVTRSKLFVPVYLDGDTENAQRIGEEFGVLGYPTMIVFDPAGSEITRIPGGIDMQAYANVLDLTLASTDTVATLVERVLHHNGTLEGGGCRMLAYYSWGQDANLLQDANRAEAFRTLHDACPATEREARSVLFMSYLIESSASSNDPDDPIPLSEEQKEEALEYLAEVLGDSRLMRVNSYALMFDGATIAAALTVSGSPERQHLTRDWRGLLDVIAADESVFLAQRLYANYGKTQFERIDDPDRPLSDALRKEILAAVQAADEATSDVYERQSVINTAANVLVEAGLTEEATGLLLKELEISKEPYYFMSGLAEIQQEAGNYDEAIGWLKRAYDEAKGPATRFQWGTDYVTGLIDMMPEEADLIEGTSLQLIAELGETRAFYQRPKRHLERLEEKLAEWNENGARESAIGSIRMGVQSICSKIPPQEPSRETCEAFLST